MPRDWSAIIAGLAGGANALGTNLAKKGAEERAAKERAMEQLLAQAKQERTDEDYGTPFAAEGEEGPGMYQANKRGEKRALGLKPPPPRADALGDYMQRPQRVESTDPTTGKTVYTWLKPGEEAPAKASGAEGERAGLAAAFLSRLKMGKADFDNGMQFIRQYHGDLAQGKKSITPAMMAAGAAANVTQNPEAHGLTGLINNAAGSAVSGLANKAIAKSDPDYQRYVNLLNSMSLAMTEVLPRPTQQILGIEKGINTAKAGDPPERLADIQHRLDLAYEFLSSNPEGMLQKGGAKPSPDESASSSAGKVPTAEQLTRAAREPDYKAFLVSKGYQVP